MLNKRCLSLLLCVLFAAVTLLPATTAQAADGELTVDHSTSGQLAAEITAAAGGNESTYTKLKINIGSVDLSGYNDSGDWKTLSELTTLLPNASSLELVYTSGTHTIPALAMYQKASWLKTLVFTNAGGQLTGIGGSAFSQTSLSGTLTIPSTVTSIGNGAFYGCSGLTGTLTIPSSVITIEATAFYGCTGLTGTLTIPSSVTSIGTSAFNGCSGLTALSLPATGSLSIGNYVFKNCTGLSGTLTIPSSVTAIGTNAFEGCANLTALSLPASGSLTIGSSAFSGCTGLTCTLTIPSSVTAIGDSAFQNCTGLSGTLTISSTMTSIGIHTFYGCTGLTALVIPSSVTSIGVRAFYGCNKLSGTLTIPSSVTSIAESAFYNCTGITALSFPASGNLTTIGMNAFSGCTGITALSLPASGNLTTIGMNAFSGCTGITGTLTIPSSVTSIAESAFCDCANLTVLSLPASGSLTIGNNAFYHCTGLTGTLAIPSSVTAIGSGAFSGCTGLKGTVVIPSSVTSISTAAFYHCTGLTALVFKKTDSAPTMSASITDQPQITAYYPASVGNYTSQPGFPGNRVAYDDQTARITSLTINGVNGVIDEAAKIIKVDLPAGTNLSALKPVIGFIGDRVYPASGAVQNFSSSKLTSTVTPVSGTPLVYSIYIKGYPTVSGSNSISGTVGDVGDQTATATVSAAGWPEKTTLKASIGGNEDTATRVGNGRATFYFSGSLFDGFAVGRYPIMVSADATTYNHAIAPAQIGTLTVKPIAPVIKTATAGDTSVTITWDAVSSADGYKVYSFDPGTKAYTEIATTTSTSYTQSGLAQGATYYYAVSSYQTVSGSPIYSNYSAAASAATPAPPTPPADPPKPADPPADPPADSPVNPPADPPADPPANPQAPTPTPTPATLPHVGTFLCNKVPAKANAGTAITILPSAAPKGHTMQSVSYSSSNPSVATVDANGNVTFIAGGKVTIVTKIVSQMTDKKGRIITKTTTVKKTVTVKQPIAAISLNLAEITVARTKKVKLTPAIAPSTASNKKLKWTSSNPKVAAVSSAGVVTGKAGGTAVITCIAKDGSGVLASCTVTVTPIYPAGLKMSKAALTVKAGKTASLKATITPKNTDFKTVTWASSNPAVATVDTKGKVKGLSKGTVTITATTSNGISVSCTVTVP